MTKYVLAIDNGTTSTRAIIFSDKAEIIASAQLPTTQVFPDSGWVEQDPQEIWHNTSQVIDQALQSANLAAADISAVGITNQRETTIMWDITTGKPVCNAIVWQDMRTQAYIDHKIAGAAAGSDGLHMFSEKTGLPLTPYFSASKINWILNNVPQATDLLAQNKLAFGTPDTWILWNLSGGVNGGVHKTDVTNASRTLLMNLHTLEWDAELIAEFGANGVLLPQIVPSSGVFALATGSLAGVPISGILGDQQAATFGQAAFSNGESKNTYGTGNFLMINTGERLVASQHGLITTVAYQLEGKPANFALEGSVAVSGSLIQWLIERLQLIDSFDQFDELCASVSDAGGVMLVPAFSGLFAPYWRTDARGVIVGLTRYSTRAHICRAALEAVAYQTRDVFDAMTADMHSDGRSITELKVDGGMVKNDLLMQFQSDILGVPVVRPRITETTALGAAFAAGLAVGVWADFEQLRALWVIDARWRPQGSAEERDRRMRVWHKAISRSLDWIDDDSPAD